MADEAAGRAAIARTIDALNQFPASRLSTADASGGDILARLPRRECAVYGIVFGNGAPVAISTPEVWSEVPPGNPPVPGARMLNPAIAVRSIRFVTADAALVDAGSTWTPGDGPAEATPLFLVLVRSTGAWKIAAARQTAEP